MTPSQTQSLPPALPRVCWAWHVPHGYPGGGATWGTHTLMLTPHEYPGGGAAYSNERRSNAIS